MCRNKYPLADQKNLLYYIAQQCYYCPVAFYTVLITYFLYQTKILEKDHDTL